MSLLWVPTAGTLDTESCMPSVTRTNLIFHPSRVTVHGTGLGTPAFLIVVLMQDVNTQIGCLIVRLTS